MKQSAPRLGSLTKLATTDWQSRGARARANVLHEFIFMLKQPRDDKRNQWWLALFVSAADWGSHGSSLCRAAFLVVNLAVTAALTLFEHCAYRAWR
jgi:hypothetical protein